MRKLFVFALGVLFLSLASLASAYTINDAVGDRIGGWKFEIYGIDISNDGTNSFFDIYTNYPIHQTFTVGTWKTFAGDLALSTTDDYDWSYGVAFTDHDGFTKGTIYNNATWNISNDYEPAGGNYIYNENHFVTLKNGSVFGPGSVTWTQIDTLGAPNGPDYKVTVTIPKLDGYTPDFQHTHWASATCANDFVGAPEPVASILFLTGGSVLLARRLRRVKK